MILRLVLQHYETPRTISYEEKGNQQYSTYGNDKASADQIMQPKPMPEHIQVKQKEGIPITHPDDIKLMQEHEMEMRDYEAFLQYFNDVGDLDPIYFDFDIEIQTDSMLPMDKQARANLYMRLLQMKAIDPQAVLEFLQIPNASEIINRMMKMEQAQKGGGQMDPKQMEAMKANPQLAQQYMQQTGQGG